MQEQIPEQHPKAPSQLYLGAIWLGMVAFGFINFFLFVNYSQLSSSIAALIYILVLGAVVAALYFLLRLRNFAIGLVVGFIALSLVSGGSCTLFTPSVDYSSIGAALLYAFALIIVGIAAIIEHFFNPPWRRS